MKSVEIAAAWVIVLAVGGCQRSSTPRAEAKIEVMDRSSVTRFYDAQIANGARNDATLRAAQFDEDRLNALGKAKLEAMLKADRRGVLVVYLDMAGADAKKESVAAYLKDHGVEEGEFELKGGANPDVGFAAAPAIRNLPKTDSGEAAGGDPSGGAAGAGLPSLGSAMQALTK